MTKLNRTRWLEHRRLHLHSHKFGPLCNFSRNMANIFLELLYRTIFLVTKGFCKMHIHWPERIHTLCFFIPSIYFVVIRLVFVGSAFCASRPGRPWGFRRGGRSVLLQKIIAKSLVTSYLEMIAEWRFHFGSHEPCLGHNSYPHQRGRLAHAATGDRWWALRMTDSW